jgi:DNA replication protein DnaC
MTTTENYMSLIKTVRAEEAYCKKHGAYKRYVNRMKQGSPCPRCAEERERKIAEKKRSETLEQEREDRNRFLRFCRIEPEHYLATLENYVPQNETQQKALDMVKALVGEYKKRGVEYVPLRHGKLIISGHNGLGKTHLAAAAVKELRGQIWTMFEISAYIRSGYSQKSAKTEIEIIEELTRLPLLAIDEIGRSKGKEAEMNWLSIIVDKRHSRGLPIILLTNKPFRKDCTNGLCLEDFVDTDIISRFRDGGARVTLTGDDYRSILGNQKKSLLGTK